MTKTSHKANTKRSNPTEAPPADPNATMALIVVEHGCEEPTSPCQQPIDAFDEAIRIAAHRKWEAARCPAGDGFDFWLEAEREVNAERSESSFAQG